MKKILLSLLGIITLGLINFGSCEQVKNLVDYIKEDTFVLTGRTNYNVLQVSSDDYGTYCVSIEDMLYNSTAGYSYIGFGYSSTTSSTYGLYLNTYSNKHYGSTASYDTQILCLNVSQPYISFYNTFSYDFEITYKLFKLNVLLDENCPVMTNFECQQTYDLIPISSVDSNYCEINNLCPSGGGECIEGSGFSDIFIYSNNRYFPLTGTNSVFINLPDYLNYSYDYSNGGNDLDIDLGYSVDSSYLSGIKDLQLTTPNQVDLNNIVSGLLPLFVPGLVVILFLYFVFRFLKKIF